MRKGTDGELIHLTMYCALCGWNKTGQLGFYLKGKEYCVTCYPLMVNAYLATKRLIERGEGGEVSSLEEIKEIGEIKWCLPGFMLKQKDCGKEMHILEVVGLLIEKIDEMVRHVNELSKRNGEVMRKLEDMREALAKEQIKEPLK